MQIIYIFIDTLNVNYLLEDVVVYLNNIVYLRSCKFMPSFIHVFSYFPFAYDIFTSDVSNY